METLETTVITMAKHSEYRTLSQEEIEAVGGAQVVLRCTTDNGLVDAFLAGFIKGGGTFVWDGYIGA